MNHNSSAVSGGIFKGPYCNHYETERWSEEKEFFDKFQLHELYENEFNIFVPMHLNCNNLYTLKNAQNLYKIKITFLSV
jgi:hypothetical protein